MQIVLNINNTSLKDFLDIPIFQELEKAQMQMPKKCTECCWEKVCGGGHLIDRFSQQNRFNNPSTYCDVMIAVYAHITKCLLKFGINVATIQNSLEL